MLSTSLSGVHVMRSYCAKPHQAAATPQTAIAMLPYMQLLCAVLLDWPQCGGTAWGRCCMASGRCHMLMPHGTWPRFRHPPLSQALAMHVPPCPIFTKYGAMGMTCTWSELHPLAHTQHSQCKSFIQQCARYTSPLPARSTRPTFTSARIAEASCRLALPSALAFRRAAGMVV